jgi:hypothetical protein
MIIVRRTMDRVFIEGLLAGVLLSGRRQERQVADATRAIAVG